MLAASWWDPLAAHEQADEATSTHRAQAPGLFLHLQCPTPFPDARKMLF
jgi:hypothetical protein